MLRLPRDAAVEQHREATPVRQSPHFPPFSGIIRKVSAKVKERDGICGIRIRSFQGRDCGFRIINSWAADTFEKHSNTREQ